MLMLVALATTFVGCSEDDLDPKSVLDDTTASEEKSEFDNWLLENYTKEYNIAFKYRYTDMESDASYNVIPAEYEKSKALAIIVKHIWLEAYKEVMGEEFIKTYTPRVIQLIGSLEYNANGSQILGTAEQGMKIMLYGVNGLDLDNMMANADNPWDKTSTPPNLNYYYFHTMHHEFCHILTQTKNYSTDYQTISAGSYQASNWVNLDDDKAPAKGFVSGYASQEYNEDFAEVFATYVTSSDAGWQKIIDAATDDGKEDIEEKLTMVKEYFQDSWGVNIDDLRKVVLRRSAEVPMLDVRTLN